MGYGAYLKDLLRPLGVYRLEGSIGGAELESLGQALDGVGAELDRVQREMCLATAEDEGLEAVERLLVRRPVASDPARRRAAVAGEGKEPQTVEVRFPEVPGIPDGFEEMRAIIEEILPCHLRIDYMFWYVTWAIMEHRFQTWGEIEQLDLSWEELEKLVM